MKGNNSLELNLATMIEAMQEWCDAHLQDKVKVTKVSEKQGMTQAFVIQVTDPEAAE